MLLQRKFRSSVPTSPGPHLLLRLVLLGLVVVSVFGAVIGVSAAPANATVADITITELTFRGAGGDGLVRGAVVAPAAMDEPHPGMVLVHGSGPHTWTDFRREAQAFARAGIVTLIYDKRTDGYSLMERDFDLLADDALAAVAALRQHDAVDASRVGLLGFSEGGWVAPLAAAASDDIAFLVEVGASGLPPVQAQAWSYGNWLRHAGVEGSLLQAAQITGPRSMVTAGMFPEADHDPLPSFERMRQPVLAIWGVHDQQVPGRESALAMEQALERGGNRNYTIRFVADARHTMESSPDGFARSDDLAPGYIETVSTWVNGLTGRTPGVSVEPAPSQAQHSSPLPPATSMASWLLVAAIPALLTAFAAYPLTAAVRRVTGRRGAPPMRRSARWLAGLGLLSVLGTVTFFGFLAATGAQQIGPVIAGRPVAWLMLQVLAVGAVIAAVATLTGWLRVRHQLAAGTHARLGALLAGGLLFVPWAMNWGLLIP